MMAITNALTGDFEWPVGEGRVTWYDPREVPKPGKVIDCSLATLDRIEIGDRFWSAKEVLRIVAAAHDRGRRDMLNTILAPNPEVAARLIEIKGDDWRNPEGKLPFDVVLWVTCVAEQQGIKSKDEAEAERSK